MSEQHWLPMFTAPRDGTAVMLLQTDFSGVEISYWDEHPKHGSGWFRVLGKNYTEFFGGEDDYAGWIPLPDAGQIMSKLFPDE